MLSESIVREWLLSVTITGFAAEHAQDFKQIGFCSVVSPTLCHVLEMDQPTYEKFVELAKDMYGSWHRRMDKPTKAQMDLECAVFWQNWDVAHSEKNGAVTGGPIQLIKDDVGE